MKYIFVLFIAFYSCNNNDVLIKDIRNTVDDQWLFASPVDTDIDIKDKTQKYDISYFISYSKDYPFQNIYLRITDDFAGKINTDTVNVNLSDKAGYWKGDKTGDYYEYEVLLHKNFSFTGKQNNYHIKIEQFTRQDTLNGIHKTGVIIKKHKDTAK